MTNDLKPVLCELTGDSKDPKNPRRVRDLVVGDLLDYLKDVPRDTPFTYHDDGRTDAYVPLRSIAFKTAKPGDDGYTDARSWRTGTPIVVVN